MTIEPFIQRLTECIVDGPVSQTVIADYCGVTKQSVGGWKRNGYISRENLMQLSEITGYRYLWLKTGTGPKLIDDADKNATEFRTEEYEGSYVTGSGSLGNSDEGQDLIEAIAQAAASKQINKKALAHLAAFFRELAKG